MVFRIVYIIKESVGVFSNNYEDTSLPKKKIYERGYISISFINYTHTQIFIYYIEATWLLDRLTGKLW